MSKKQDFKNEHVMKLQGKDYLPVAPRVVMFRQEHPDYSILTETKEVAGDAYVYAAVLDAKGFTLATAHKRVRKDAKGPAALWPLETAETGAIGRALALCGYGTLSGDLDEGDQLADAPVERELEPQAVGPKPTSISKREITKKPSDTVEKLVAQLNAVKTRADFDAAYDSALTFLDDADAGTNDERVLIKQAGTRARNRIA